MKNIRFIILVTLLALLLAGPAAWAVQVFVQLPTGITITLEVEPTDSIEALKAKIQEKEGFPPYLQTFYFGDIELQEGKTISDYEIEKESSLRLVVKSNDENHPVVVDSWVFLQSQMAVGGYVRLGADVAPADPATSGCLEVSAGVSVTLDLNGHTINRNLAEPNNNGHVFKVISNTTLTITDSSTGGTGIISGGNADNGGAIYIDASSSLTIEGGTIAGCQADYGGAIYNMGTLTINGGTIQNCTATRGWGQGIIYNNGNLTINGGTIQNNTAFYGGAIYNVYGWTTTINGGVIQNNNARENNGYYTDDGVGGGIVNFGILYLYGGTIQGNSCDREGGGIWLSSDWVAIYMKGNPVVKDNTNNSGKNNVYIPEDKFILVDGSITEDAFIGVTTSKYFGDGIARGKGAYTLTVADARHFSSDAGTYYVGLNDDREVFFTDDADDAHIVGITLTGHQHGGVYWATFYNQNVRFTLAEGAQAYTMDSDHHLYRLGDDGHTIPAGKAVVIIADKQDITLTLDDGHATVADHSGGNQLRGSDSAVTLTAGKVDGKTPYVLGVVNDVAGFYKFTGAQIPAGKAYYLVTP